MRFHYYSNKKLLLTKKKGNFCKIDVIKIKLKMLLLNQNFENGPHLSMFSKYIYPKRFMSFENEVNKTKLSKKDV